MTNNNTYPTGTVTFLFTDIEDSTRLWEAHPRSMRASLARHDELLRAAVSDNNGLTIKTTGDGIHAVFTTAQDGVAAALASQRALQAEEWDTIQPDAIRVRAGLHSGEAELREGDYYGSAVNRAARLMSIGHGGQVLLSGVTAVLAGSGLDEDILLNDLGDVRLKGLNRPEHVYQLIADDLPASFPPLKTDAATRSNLPAQITSFVGRESEKVEVQELLQNSRLLTLTGPGGTGKTRLSLEVAGDLLDDFQHGTWLVELAPLSDPAAVPAAVAGVWGLQDSATVPPEQVLADYLRGKELLLILDNCEHLVQACARLAADLLPIAPRLTILASSREGLSIAGETTFHLPTLPVPGRDVTDPETLQTFDSVQLFFQRAQSARPGFELNADNAAAVGRIVRRLDGIPLAIELAAARLKLLPPEQLAERLDDRFRLLTGGSRTALPRQQTLRALIDWSYDHLNPEEQALFRQLGVFAGGWSLEAVEGVVDLRGLPKTPEVLDDPDTFDLLANLVNKSLVVMEDEDGAARFRFLETIRQYARDRLFEAGEGEGVRDRHRDYFAALVIDDSLMVYESERLHIMGGAAPANVLAWVSKVGTNFDNVGAALEWALATDPQQALAMAANLPMFSIFEGPLKGNRDNLDEALQKVNELEPVAGEAAVERDRLLVLGNMVRSDLLMGVGRNQPALESLQIAETLAEAGNQAWALPMIYMIQASLWGFMGRPGAFDRAAAAVHLYEEMGDPIGPAYGWIVMAAQKIRAGEREAGQTMLARGRAILSNKVYEDLIDGVTYWMMARLAEQQGNIEEAYDLLQKARGNIRSPNFGTLTESEMGHLRRRSGDDDAAEAIYRRTIRQFQDAGHQAAVAHQLESLAFIAVHREQYVRAATMLGAAEAIRERVDATMLPEEKTEYDAEVATMRAGMEAEPVTAAWSAGRRMDMDAVVDYALTL